MAVAAKRKTTAGKARAGAAKKKGAAAKAPPRKKAAAKKAKAPRKAAPRISAAEIEALTDRVGMLENKLEDIGATTFLLRKVLTKALRQTPHLVPLHDEHFKLDDEDGGGGK